LRAVSGAGSAGWLTTEASTAGSTAIASANPPVKHMPTAPTPGPPYSPCALAASARSQPTTGLVRSASMVNSRATQTRSADRSVTARLSGSPGRPNSDGRYTL